MERGRLIPTAQVQGPLIILIDGDLLLVPHLSGSGPSLLPSLAH